LLSLLPFSAKMAVLPMASFSPSADQMSIGGKHWLQCRQNWSVALTSGSSASANVAWAGGSGVGQAMFKDRTVPKYTAVTELHVSHRLV
jgi:hypothetical protein